MIQLVSESVLPGREMPMHFAYPQPEVPVSRQAKHVSANRSYQSTPPTALPPMPAAAERASAAETFFSPGGTGYASMDDFKAHGGKLYICCGFPGGETIYRAPGYSVSWLGESEQWNGWDSDTYFCRQNSKELEFR